MTPDERGYAHREDEIEMVRMMNLLDIDSMPSCMKSPGHTVGFAVGWNDPPGRRGSQCFLQ